jgi:hypothetical protein
LAWVVEWSVGVTQHIIEENTGIVRLVECPQSRIVSASIPILDLEIPGMPVGDIIELLYLNQLSFKCLHALIEEVLV